VLAIDQSHHAMAESDLLDLGSEREFKVDVLNDLLVCTLLVKMGRLLTLVVDHDHVQVGVHADLLFIDYCDSFRVPDSQEVAHVYFCQLVACELCLVEYGELGTGDDCKDPIRFAVIAGPHVLLGFC